MKVISKILSLLLFILLIPYHIFVLFIRGFSVLSLFLSRGFYFYFEKASGFLYRIIPFSFFETLQRHFQKRQEQPTHIVCMIVLFLVGVSFYGSFYENQELFVKQLPDVSSLQDSFTEAVPSTPDNYYLSMNLSLFEYYGKFSYSDISLPSLREKNSDTVLWMIVEGTNINYPIVQATDNDYYLNHSFDKSYTTSGWPFLDYRNRTNMEDRNTIYYGHNLLNGTSFGSLKYLFQRNESGTHILILTDTAKYTYEVFSIYETYPEVYYLQTNFYDDDAYKDFLSVIQKRSILTTSTTVNTDDRILTLSTCTDDNKGRKVVHAKLISVD